MFQEVSFIYEKNERIALIIANKWNISETALYNYTRDIY